MKNRITQTLTLALAATLLAACQDYLPLGGVTDGGTNGKDPSSEYFNFSTTKEVAVNLDYGKLGRRALVNLYTEDPQYIGADGDIYISDEADFSVFLDNNGRFKGKVVLPADTKKVWAYTSRANLPELLLEEVGSDDKVDIDGEIKKGSPDYSQPGFTPYDQLTFKDGKKTLHGYSDFDVLGESSETDIIENGGKSYTIWRAATRGDDIHKIESKVFSITNWNGQRFGRIKETHYFDKEGRRHDVKDTYSKSKPYDTQGLLEDFSEVVNDEHDPDVMGTDDIETIQQFLWNGRTTKPEGLKNRKYYKDLDTEDINIAIPNTYIEDGEVKTIDKAQVWMRFLGEGAFWCDGIGYYVYDTNDPPQSMDDIKAYYVVFPNTSSTAPYDVENNTFKGRTVPFTTYLCRDGKWTTDEDFGITNISALPYVYSYEEYDPETKKYVPKSTDKSTTAWNPKYVPFDINQRLQLLYHEFEYDTNGNIKTTKVSKYFPAGKTIGFFLCTFLNDTGWSTTGNVKEHETFRIACNMDFFHSNWRLNAPQKGYGEGDYDWTTGEGKASAGTIGDDGICRDKSGNAISLRHFIALNYGNFAVYGVEDGVDESMGDVLFTIKTDPIGIVVNDDRTTILPNMYATTTNHRTYCFEDIWPTGGDYDMNDVVIDHHHRMTIKRDGDGNIYNDWIKSIEDDFTAIQPEGSATYQDAFGFQIPKSRLEELDELKSRMKEEEKEWAKDRMEGMTGTYAIKVEKIDNDGKKILLTEGTDYFIEDDDEILKEAGKEPTGNITIILFTDARDNNVRYNKYTVTRVFSDVFAEEEDHNLHIDNTQLEQQNGKNVLNPFIISQYDKKSDDGRIEIHLPKHSPTAKGLVLNDNSDPANYYVGKYEGKQAPFAISLPKSAFNYPWGQHFANISGEGIEIGDAYPKYSEWVTSKGATDTDWYKYPTDGDNSTTQSE